jgi:hypothetical protein
MMMSVDAADIAELRRMKAAEPALDLGDFIMLESIEEIVGYLVACSREIGSDESDMVETLVRLLELPPDEVRDLERILRPLGYRDVCGRLRQITGRRRGSLVPLP